MAKAPKKASTIAVEETPIYTEQQGLSAAERLAQISKKYRDESEATESADVSLKFPAILTKLELIAAKGAGSLFASGQNEPEIFDISQTKKGRELFEANGFMLDPQGTMMAIYWEIPVKPVVEDMVPPAVSPSPIEFVAPQDDSVIDTTITDASQSNDQG